MDQGEGVRTYQEEIDELRAQLAQLTTLLNTTAQNALAATQAATAAETRDVAAETAAQGRAPAKVSKRVDVVPDPGTFDGSYARFDKWWCKMSTYLACNDDCFPTDVFCQFLRCLDVNRRRLKPELQRPAGENYFCVATRLCGGV